MPLELKIDARGITGHERFEQPPMPPDALGRRGGVSLAAQVGGHVQLQLHDHRFVGEQQLPAVGECHRRQVKRPVGITGGQPVITTSSGVRPGRGW